MKPKPKSIYERGGEIVPQGYRTNNQGKRTDQKNSKKAAYSKGFGTKDGIESNVEPKERSKNPKGLPLNMRRAVSPVRPAKKPR